MRADQRRHFIAEIGWRRTFEIQPHQLLVLADHAQFDHRFMAGAGREQRFDRRLAAQHLESLTSGVFTDNPDQYDLRAKRGGIGRDVGRAADPFLH